MAVTAANDRPTYADFVLRMQVLRAILLRCRSHFFAFSRATLQLRTDF
jgi:hypothetical protein